MVDGMDWEYKKRGSGEKCTKNFCWKTFEETSWDIDKESSKSQMKGGYFL